MKQNAVLIRQFYEAFQKRDAAGMHACYHPDVESSDPVFPALKGAKARAMWSMLCERGKDLALEFRDVKASDATGAARWEARYTFSQTGRAVHNLIDATFVFRDGKIVRHTDRFDLHRWAGQALGLPGKLLGGTGFMQNKIRVMADKGLNDYLARSMKI